MSSHLNPSPSSEPLSEADERAIDALLDEIGGRAPIPPDFSTAILRDLAKSTPLIIATQTVAAASPVRTTSLPSRQARRLPLPLIGIAALAATALLAVTIVYWQSNKVELSKKSEGAVVPVPIDLAQQSQPAAAPSNGAGSDSNLQTPPKVREGVPLVRRSNDQGKSNGSMDAESPAATESLALGRPLDTEATLVGLNSSLQSYWKSVGVEPTPSISEAEWTERVKARYGSPPLMRSKDEVQEFALRWFDRVMKGVPLRKDARPAMIAEAIEVIATHSRFDELISRWVASDQWLDTSRPDRLAQSLASNLLGVDAACSRCHDSPLDGQFSQHDFWAFAAIFNSPDNAPLFYELRDGRQRVAEPQVPSRWLKAASADDSITGEATPREQFARSLKDNDLLAAALTNQLWHLAYGAPLVATPSDPMAPPQEDALQDSHRMLANAFSTSGFDVQVMAKLIASSAPMYRDSSELSRSGRWKLADRNELAAAIQAQRTFAASPTVPQRMGRDQLLAVMQSRLGNSPRELKENQPVLAQPRIDDSSGLGKAVAPIEKPTLEELAWSEWVVESERLQNSWLHWIKDDAEQQRHAIYAGDALLQGDAPEIVARLATSETDARSANDRLFWVLHKSR